MKRILNFFKRTPKPRLIELIPTRSFISTYFLDGKKYFAAYHHKEQVMRVYGMNKEIYMNSDNPTIAEFQKAIEQIISLNNQDQLKVVVTSFS